MSLIAADGTVIPCRVQTETIVEIIYIVVMYVYVNKNNTKIGIQHTIKDYGKHIANVSFSNV